MLETSEFDLKLNERGKSGESYNKVIVIWWIKDNIYGNTINFIGHQTVVTHNVNTGFHLTNLLSNCSCFFWVCSTETVRRVANIAIK